LSEQATMTRDERSSYYMQMLGAEYVNSHFGSATPLAIQQLTQNRYRSNPTTMVDHILSVANLGGTESVIDVGCGNGFILRDVASRMRAGGTITAVDIASGMLAAAKDNVNFQWAPITWINRDARELEGLVDGKFDLVMANYIFHYITDCSPFCATLASLTNQTGRALVTVEGLDSMYEMYAVHLDAMRALGIDETAIDRVPHGRRGSLSTHNGKSLLEEHFPSVVEHPYKDSLVFTEPEAFIEFYAAGHRFCGAQPLLEEELGAEFFDRLAAEVASRVQHVIDDEGEFIVNKENSVFYCSPSAS